MSYLTIDPAAFAAGFDRTAFTIGHTLAGHPAFGLERLVELAKTLPPGAVEYNAGDLPVSLDAPSPRNGLSTEETIRGIEDHNSWMVLQNVEQVPVYRELLMACVAEIAPFSEPIRPGMCQPEAYIFVSSAGAVTPYHMDPEHNFLLQIRGEKTVTVFDGASPAVLTAPDLERFYGGTAYRSMVLPDSALASARNFSLSPGIGVHVPVTHPHYVKVGPSYSVSFSTTFRSPDLFRTAHAYRFNAFLRRRGFNPSRIRKSSWIDSIKAYGGQSLVQVAALRAGLRRGSQRYS